MEFKEFIKQRRQQLALSQADIADGLSYRGQETSPGRVGHWETGRNKPPLESQDFREALASVLDIDVNEMMDLLGYIVSEDARSAEARIAANIVDHLPQQAKEIALDFLKTLERRFVTD